MISVEKNKYRLLKPEEGALYVIAAEQTVMAMDLPGWFTDGLFTGLKDVIDSRREHGFDIDPTIREDVNGLVNSYLGPNDHVHKVSVELKRFVVGWLQTDESVLNETLQNVSNSR